TPDEVVVSVLPMHHTYGLACMLAELLYGVRICINDSLRHVLRNFARFRPTALILVPLFVQTMYKKILNEAEKKGKLRTFNAGIAASRVMMKVGVDLRKKLFAEVREAFGGRLEKIICGGAPLKPDLIYAFEDFGISIYEGYGITECAPLAAVTPYYKRKSGSVGPSVPCCTIRVDGETINEAGFAEGEIQIHGDNVMLGYFENPEANAAAFTDDGWYRTGDVGYMDADGYVYITGRMKSVIVLENGKNVFPEEIEEYLSAIDLIAESVVVGRKSEDGDSVILTAIVFPNADKFDENATDEEKLEAIKHAIRKINKKLPSFKQVREVELRNEEFPKTTSKKIRRHLIK
ncbi:MAG: AMP-binding protein, partial [Clostridia bacterium]|nr:AMP-binding protein [Clostridia bacterium]